LPTTLYNITDEEFKYYSETDHFSIFSITAEKETAESEKITEVNETTTTIINENKKKGLDWW